MVPNPLVKLDLQASKQRLRTKEKKSSASPQADDSSWLSPSRCERGDSWLYRSRTMVGRGSFAFAGFCGHPVELAELSCRHSTLVPAFVGERWVSAQPCCGGGEGSRGRARTGWKRTCHVPITDRSRPAKTRARRREDRQGRGLWFGRLLFIMDHGFMDSLVGSPGSR